ncbi:MAG: AAC(3)-I family aminoglycoside N-acetyltransferase [Pseudomonadota bacterium]
MSEIDVVRLGPDDVSAMRALLTVLGTAFEDLPRYRSQPPGDDYLKKQLARPSVVVLCALEDDAVVGGLIAYDLPKFEQARSEMYLYDIAVADTHRRRGVATALIERLKVIASDAGAWVIFVQADDDDPPAIALYRGLGTEERVRHFDVPVPAETSRDD